MGDAFINRLAQELDKPPHVIRRALDNLAGRGQVKIEPAIRRACFGHGDTDWQWCAKAGCTRGSYKQKPACMSCAGYDPRTGEGMADGAQVASTNER